MRKLDEIAEKGLLKDSKALTPEQWRDLAERFETAAKMFAEILRRINAEGRGAQDAEEWLTDAHLVYMATRWVGEFASDKCRIVIIPDNAKSTPIVQ